MNTTSAGTIKILLHLFAVEVLPETIVTDKGPYFTLAEFKQFSAHNGISLIHSAPCQPASNRWAERVVQTFKTQLDKLLSHHPLEEAVLLFLATYGAAPLGCKRPAEILRVRPFRCPLSVLVPEASHPPAFILVHSFHVGQGVWSRIFSHPQARRAPAIITEFCSWALAFLRWADGSATCRHLNKLGPRMVDHDAPGELPVSVDGRSVTEPSPQPLPPPPAAPAASSPPGPDGQQTMDVDQDTPHLW
ncbi:uncharacterized protein LOC126154492 [Schistocerca cancellata]|uniref:uncharacterized protein LOC126154492 n=1 Tax=Schistocerca cancellata TaxID=274614 RepID=UPI0021173257|nr:uncharacterized protein LOC126154492 [Schistocerca cancellata]